MHHPTNIEKGTAMSNTIQDEQAEVSLDLSRELDTDHRAVTRFTTLVVDRILDRDEPYARLYEFENLEGHRPSL
jgi:hypothetical protein